MTEQSRLPTFIASSLPVLLLILIEGAIFLLQTETRFAPHFAIGVFAAQLICLIVFIRGEICPGQRGRLIRTNRYFAFYWLAILFINPLINQTHIFTTLISLFGLSALYLINKHSKPYTAGRNLLIMSALINGFGIFAYLIFMARLPTFVFVEFNPIAQLLAGILLTNLALTTARSRLQRFLALLPLTFVITLACNALIVFIYLLVISLTQTESAVDFDIIFAYVLYFAAHLLAAAIIAFPLLRHDKLTYSPLLILFFIITYLPLWGHVTG